MPSGAAYMKQCINEKADISERRGSNEKRRNKVKNVRYPVAVRRQNDTCPVSTCEMSCVL